MQEYKREKNTLESQLKEMRKKARYHDDHLQIIDSWFKQLIDEVKLMSQTDGEEDVEMTPAPSALLFADQEKFEEHLQSRSKEIRSVMTRLFGNSRPASPEVSELRARLAQLLASEKDHILQLERAQAEKEELESRLENASLRYMVAEKKIDRAKSITVAKFEKQALLGAQRPSSEDGGLVKREDSTMNGTTDHSEELAETEAQYNKAVAASEKQKMHINKLEKENSELSAKVTELSTKTIVLTDEDYAKTELFKQLKAQHEDVIKRINDLEATNKDLRDEALKLQSERTAYQAQLEAESRTAIAENNSRLAAVEADLARIRSDRDDRIADQAIKRATLDQDRDALRRVQELVSAQEDRIKALQSENERLMTQSDNSMQTSELDNLSMEELRSKYREIERKYSLLNGELASMSTAFQKTSKIASQKVSDYSALEEKVVRLSAEKAKADQVYFAARKKNETRDVEIKSLRMQTSTSAEKIATLKEADATSRALLANLEKQVAGLKDAYAVKTKEHRACQQKSTTQESEMMRLNSQITDLKQLLNSKDDKLATTSSLCRQAEVEAEELKASLTDTRRNLETWKSKSGQSEQYEMLRVC